MNPDRKRGFRPVVVVSLIWRIESPRHRRQRRRPDADSD